MKPDPLPRAKKPSCRGKGTEVVRTYVEDDPVSTVLWKLNHLYCRRVHGFHWQQEDPLPRHGPGILVCNHQSSVDPFILAAATRRILSFLVATEYHAIAGLRWLLGWMGCVPVRRDRQEVAAVRGALFALEQGRLLCVFPEGGIDRGFESPRLGVGYLAWRSGAPVFPASVTGTPKGLSVRRALFTRSRSSVLFGEPLVLPHDRPGRPDRQRIAGLTAQITDAITRLKTG